MDDWRLTDSRVKQALIQFSYQYRTAQTKL